MIFNKLIKKTIFFLGFGLIYINSSFVFAANSDYAALPPFISADVKPNVLFVMDYSGSMQGPANYSTASHNYDGGVINYGNFSDNIYANYDKDKIYFGYFDPEKYYKYNSSDTWGNDDDETLSGYWEVDNSISFEDRRMGDLEGSLSGNFLNCLLMTRVDVTYKSLFGGLADCPDNKDYCVLKSRGSKRDVYLSSDEKVRVSIRPESYGNNDAYFTDAKIKVEKGEWKYNWGWRWSGTEVFDRHGRVKIDKEERKGIIQENFDKVRFGFMAYADTNNDTAYEGKIKYGFDDNNYETPEKNEEEKWDDIIKKFQKTNAYQGTHTGEGLDEAYDYLRQTEINDYNSNYDGEGNLEDPYYEKNSDGEAEFAFCRKSFVVLISDGAYRGDIDPDVSAHNIHKNDLRDDDDEDEDRDQIADVYSLYAFGDNPGAENSMKTVAAFGQYKDLEGCGDGSPYGLDVDDDSEDNKFDYAGTDEGCYKEWDSDLDGNPDGFYSAKDGEAMANALTAIFSEIRQGTASGTSATSLTTKLSSGTVMNQAAFYPEKEFDDQKKVVWTGDLVANWYLNDVIKNEEGEYVGVQNIREDTDEDKILDLTDDKILEYLVDVESQELVIKAYSVDDYGFKDSTEPKEYSKLNEVPNLIDYGKKLKIRNPSGRTIYGVDKSDNKKEFKVSNVPDFDDLFGTNLVNYPTGLITTNDEGDNIPDYEKLINYVRGKDYDDLRSRATNAESDVWKLGDIAYSSPAIVDYGKYSVMYVGSNDGMLHAFRMGYLKNTGEGVETKLCNDNSENCSNALVGEEEWAFIPKDAMPFLRYMASPDYEHIYTVDLKPYIINTEIDGEKKVILIGGMRLGGGSTEDGNIKFPDDTGDTEAGRSSYYALDITDRENPEYLWRYAPDGLGFSYSGPAYVKRKDSAGNYKHFLIFASGPTDYDGSSTQDLQIFTIDLYTGAEKDVYGDVSNELGINKAYGGRLFNNGLDVNEDGQTDFVFLGYTDKADKDYSKMNGGIIKIYTGSHDPESWDYDKNFLSTSGNPITAPVMTMECFPNEIDFPYLYFGTGRYFVSDDDTQDGETKVEEDATNDTNYLYGVPFIYDEHNEKIKNSSINNIKKKSRYPTCQDIIGLNDDPLKARWKIELDPNTGGYLRERCYSDPSVTDRNIVFFNTSQPTNAICKCGGRSRAWSLNCATGRGLGYNVPDNNTTGCTVGDKYTISDANFNYITQLSQGNIKDYEYDPDSDEGDFDSLSGATEYEGGVSSESGGSPVFQSNTQLIPGEILYWREW